ncbi:MAG: ribosome maturation factor RimM [Campylobacterales bacterium]
MASDERLLVATVGKTVGLKGDLKLHLHTDFPEQFKKGAIFHTDEGDLEILRYDEERQLVAFLGYTTPESAKMLTNTKLYVTVEESRASCELGCDEYFWFDIIGLSVVEDGEVLGVVKEIERLAGQEMLLIATDGALVAQGMAKHFVLPYIDRFIDHVDLEGKAVIVRHAKDVLEAS